MEPINSFLLGQVTFFSSTFVSRRNCLTCSHRFRLEPLTVFKTFSGVLITSFFFSLFFFGIFRQQNGRPGGIRTPNPRIWSPVLSPLELLACVFIFSLPYELYVSCKMGNIFLTLNALAYSFYF